MAVMYALACMVEDGAFPEEEERKKWTAWLDEWAEWVMHGLSRECLRISSLRCGKADVHV